MESIPFRCPVCQEPLVLFSEEHSARLGCIKGHSFDQARQGYWNLLLPQRKRSKAPGDNAEMVLARRAFLDQGFYEPLAFKIADTISEKLANCQATHTNLLDLGCGEGYYTQLIESKLMAADLPSNVIGLDISKEAIRSACRRSTSIQWLVATGADIPLMPESIDVATLIFARLLPEPTAKVLKPGALFIVVWAGIDHLRELRALIYKDVRDSDLNPDAQLMDQFIPIETLNLTYPIHIQDSTSLQNLLMMTPHGQRLTPERRHALMQHSSLKVTADIRISLYQKR
ncbi:rRNA (guanine-N1)-methyltransferase [Nitrincola tibetensis]|uniref:rRNA (Guanine-N1)-methyltransferase n=1 Tax=Nitrincola tibetensis TaxID=2219697 RepID=A0A364NJ15_9GAMM|nr:methyltransferase domain-containing protein [Nitrincola tibetensis]RAU17118.1 rRNA (guanine-N1)-methyltransferase [Nitrincola tibetensis]